MTYAEIIAREPRIRRIVEGVSVSDDGHQWMRYAHAKRELTSLVGHFADRPDLRNSVAYDVVVREITKRLGI